MDKYIDLVLRSRAGEDDAFAQLCEQYKNLMDSLSRKYSLMCEEACAQEDFRQEAQLAFFDAVNNYNIENGRVTFGAYARVCIRNRLISCVRKQNSKKRRVSKGENAGTADSWSVQDTVVRRELGEKLISVAESALSPYERKILSMYAKGIKAKEISAVIGKSEKSVNNAIYRIRLKLKRTVNQ